MTKLKRAIIMAGGTGGHVFPGLTVADFLRKQGVEVAWLGTRAGLEAQLVPKAGIRIHYIAIRGLRKNGLLGWCLAPIRLLWAILQAAYVIQQEQPDVVIGMGGFVSGPGGIASYLLRKKLIIHEQNAKPGMTNQWLAKIAARVLEAFPQTFASVFQAKTIGNPVRDNLTHLPAPPERSSAEKQPPLHLLVIGGSLGAKAINTILPQAILQLPNDLRPAIWHQTGERHLQETCQAYQQAGVTAKIVPFIYEMEQAYLWADIVICRAGALTVTELCTVGLAAILVPYPHAVDDHQTANANFLVNNQAALLLSQSELTVTTLSELLKECCASSEKRLKIAEAAYQLRQIDAAEKIFTICQEVLS